MAGLAVDRLASLYGGPLDSAGQPHTRHRTFLRCGAEGGHAMSLRACRRLLEGRVDVEWRLLAGR
jgi:hypothetical protein